MTPCDKVSVLQRYEEGRKNNYTKAVMGFFKDHRPLSNFHEEPFSYAGLIWPAAENAYQASKFTPEHWGQFLRLKPNEARTEGRRANGPWSSVEWNSRRYNAMLGILAEKFAQCPKAQACLLSTEHQHLEECNWWHDVYWGTCGGLGQNRLGEILMLIRESIQSLKNKESPCP